MTEDFKVRHRQPIPVNERLSEVHRPLMEQLRLSGQAARVISSTLARFRLSKELATTEHCRIDGNTLVILATSAAQLSRLRQLKQRLLAALAAARLPIDNIEVRIMLDTPLPEHGETVVAPARPRSALGAASIDTIISEIRDEKLRDTLSRLADTLKPDETALRDNVERYIDESAITIANENLELADKITSLRQQIEALNMDQSGVGLTRMEVKLLALKSDFITRLKALESRKAANDMTLKHLQIADQWLNSDPRRAADYLALHLADRLSPEEQKEAAAPAPVSIPGTVALEKLAAETESYQLSRTLKKLRTLIAPDRETFREALVKTVREEIGTLTAAGQAGTKRLGELNTALASLLFDENCSAEDIAKKLYNIRLTGER